MKTSQAWVGVLVLMISQFGFAAEKFTLEKVLIKSEPIAVQGLLDSTGAKVELSGDESSITFSDEVVLKIGISFNTWDEAIAYAKKKYCDPSNSTPRLVYFTNSAKKIVIGAGRPEQVRSFRPFTHNMTTGDYVPCN